MIIALYAAACSPGSDQSGEEPPVADAGPDVTVPSPDVSGPDTSGIDGPTYHGDVAPLLRRRCVKCHADEAIAPFRLDAYDEVAPIADLIATTVSRRLMPPLRIDNEGECGKFGETDWLTDEELETLTSWAEAGAPEGDPSRDPGGEVAAPPALDRVDVELSLPTYTPDASEPDDYRCFVVDPGFDATQYITGYEVLPDNADIVHHLIVYNVLDADGVARAKALDAADDGPGYTCFGGPGTGGTTVYAAWAPGAGATHYPEGTGLEVPAGHEFVVQVHYNLVAGTKPDSTVVNLKTEGSVRRPAFATILADSRMALPTGPDATTLVDEVHPYRAPALLSGFPLTIYGVFPHMHRLGKTVRVEHFSGDEGACVARVNEWDFDWQRIYWYDEPFVSKPGDLLRLRCTYDTTEAAAPIGWGEGTDDEMCVVGVYVGLGEDPNAVPASQIGVEVDDLAGGAGTEHATTNWVRVFGSPLREQVSDVGLAGDGSAYVAMQNAGSPVQVGEESTRREGRSGTLVKLSPAGAPLWTLALDGDGRDSIEALAVDDDGTVVIAGYFEDDASIGDARVTSVSNEEWDLVVARVSADGEVLWTTTFGGPGRDHPEEGTMHIDPNGNIVVGITIDGPRTFAGTEMRVGESSQNPAILKFDADGAPVWGRSFPAGGATQIRGIDVDPAGDVAAVGFFTESLELPGEAMTSAGDRDGFIVRLASDGSLVWQKRFGASFRDLFRDVLFAPDGSIYVAGQHSAVLSAAKSGDGFGGGMDAVLARLDADGEYIWARQIGGLSHEMFDDVELDGDGNLVVVGKYQATPDFGMGPLGNRGAFDMVFASFTPDGEPIFTDRFGGYGRELDMLLEVDGNRAVVVLSADTPLSTDSGQTERFGSLDAVVFDLGL